MAAPVAKSGTLVSNTVATVTVKVSAFGPNGGVGILNRSQTGVIWVRTDGGTPTVAGDDCFPVISYRSFSSPDGGSEVTVKMISTGALDYTVEGADGA